MNGTLLHPIITRLLNDYIPAKQRPFAGHPLGVYLRNDVPEYEMMCQIFEQVKEG